MNQRAYTLRVAARSAENLCWAVSGHFMCGASTSPIPPPPRVRPAAYRHPTRLAYRYRRSQRLSVVTKRARHRRNMSASWAGRAAVQTPPTAPLRVPHAPPRAFTLCGTAALGARSVRFPARSRANCAHNVSFSGHPTGKSDSAHARRPLCLSNRNSSVHAPRRTRRPRCVTIRGENIWVVAADFMVHRPRDHKRACPARVPPPGAVSLRGRTQLHLRRRPWCLQVGPGTLPLDDVVAQGGPLGCADRAKSPPSRVDGAAPASQTSAAGCMHHTSHALNVSARSEEVEIGSSRPISWVWTRRNDKFVRRAAVPRRAAV